MACCVLSDRLGPGFRRDDARVIHHSGESLNPRHSGESRNPMACSVLSDRLGLGFRRDDARVIHHSGESPSLVIPAKA
jgi:hypothetical protein